jgi:hypothetical protein
LLAIRETLETPKNRGCPGILRRYEALFNCVDVIKIILAYRAERGESPRIDEVTLTSEMQVTVSIPVGVNA